MSLKAFAIAATAATVALTAALPASQAEAGHRHRHDREALYAGVGFFGGLVIGSLLTENRYPHDYGYSGLPAAHVQSCFDRYRSYDVQTNTWVDYNMRTRVCYSPYFY